MIKYSWNKLLILVGQLGHSVYAIIYYTVNTHIVSHVVGYTALQ
jgi:hypothetical protein